MTALRRILVLAVLAGAASAFITVDRASVPRHLRLVKSEPAADATIASPPAAIHLWFSEEPEVKVTTLLLTVAGQAHRIAKVVADAEDAKHVIATVDSVTAAGEYSLAWRTMSRDGHVVTGEIPFTVRASN